jgi:hypothetical protein
MSDNKLGLNTLREMQVMSVNWDRDIDAALAKAMTEKRPLLLDFSAAPA